MQKPLPLIVGTRWLYAVQRHRSLGEFIAFIKRYYDLLNPVLGLYNLQSIGCVYCLHIVSPTQIEKTAGVNFYLSFLFGH